MLERDEDISPKAQVQEIIVTTIDTIRYSRLLILLIQNRIPTLYVGPTGTGKSVYIKNVLLKKLPKEDYRTIEIGFSAQTSANMAQDIVDGRLDRRKKNLYGPPFPMKCVVFVDDLNMPKKEGYGAQPPIELMRQLIDQKGWYDRKDPKHPFRNIIDTVVIAAMGTPGGGRTFITPRLMRHFNLIAFANFDDVVMTRIFTKILDWYFGTRKFPLEITNLITKIVHATMDVYKRASDNLLPTPTKSHYTFNLRDFSKVIQGICMSDKDHVSNSDCMIRLWAHEVFYCIEYFLHFLILCFFWIERSNAVFRFLECLEIGL
jgi:dynein heavy chain, axonemal